MKKYFKNLMLALAVATFLICGANSAFAYTAGGTIDFSSVLGYSAFCVFDSTGAGVVAEISQTCQLSGTYPLYYISMDGGDAIILSEFPLPDPVFTPPDFTNGCMDNTATNYNSLATHNDGSCTYATPPRLVRHNVGFDILGGTPPSTGTPLSGLAFISGTASVASTTIAGFSPVIAIVAGLIVAFLVSVFIIRLFKETDVKKNK